MEVTVTASQGPLRSLPKKLEALLLLLDGSKCMPLEGDRKRIRLLKSELEQLISEYLMEPSDVGYPALSIEYWVNELAELAYDIDDCVDKLVHRYIDGKKPSPSFLIIAVLFYELFEVQGIFFWILIQNDWWLNSCIPFTGSKITHICNKLREKLNPLRWLTNDFSEFRDRLRRAIQRYRNFHLDRWTFKPGILSDPPLLPLLDTGAPGLVGLDSSVEVLSGLLGDNEGARLKVVAIAGLGGVGKTTLAKEVYSKLRGQFECHAFVGASRRPDMRKLLTNLLLQVRRSQPVDTYEVTDLINEIRAHLRYRKYVSFSF